MDGPNNNRFPTPNGGTATNGMDINPPRGGMGGSMGGKGGIGNTRRGGGGFDMLGNYDSSMSPDEQSFGGQYQAPYMPTAVDTGESNGGQPPRNEAVYEAGVEKYGAQYTNQDGTYNGENYAKNNEDFQNRNIMVPQQQQKVDPASLYSDPNMGGGGGDMGNGEMKSMLMKPRYAPSDPNMGMGGKGGQQLSQMRTQGPESLRMQGTPLQQPSGPPAQPAFQGTLGNQNMRQVFSQPASQPTNGLPQQYTREQNLQAAGQDVGGMAYNNLDLGNQNMRQVVNRPDNLYLGGGDLQRQQAMANEASQFIPDQLTNIQDYVARPAIMSGIGSMGQIRRR